MEIETLFHFIPSGSAVELKYSPTHLPIGIGVRNISALRFTLNKSFERRRIIDGETKVIAPILARKLGYRNSIAGN
jgi:hypothetical protein